MIKYSIETILNDIFFDGTEKTIEQLKKYGLYEITQKKIDFFNNSMNQNKVTNLNAVYTAFIQSINTQLNNVGDLVEREHLKYILSNIGNHLIDKLIETNLITSNDLIDLEESLKEICELLGYDFEDLRKRTQLNRIALLLRNQEKNNGIKKESTIYYEWVSQDHNLFDYVCRNLKSEKSISSIKDFKKLFTPEPVNVTFSKDNSEFIVVLFDTLYEQKLISPRKKKGHLAPLKNYAVDFDNNILFKKEMKQIKYTIKKNTLKYDKLRCKAEKWLLN